MLDPNKTSYCLLGYSGHGLVVTEAAMLSNLNVISYADKKASNLTSFQLEYWGTETSVGFKGWKKNIKFIHGVGNNNLRSKIAEFIRSRGGVFETVIHPRALVSESADIGAGTFIAGSAVINPMVSVGVDSIINTAASIDHECTIGDSSHIAPNSVLCGNVEVGSKAFIGAGSTILPGVKIGANAIVGAGSTVISNVDANCVVVGNPARIIQSGKNNF